MKLKSVEMKRVFLFIGLIFTISTVQAQDVSTLQKSLDSLKSLKATYQHRILEIDQEYSKIEKTINDIRFEQSVGSTFYCISSTYIESSPGKDDMITYLAYGSKVKVIDQTEDHFKILYGNFKGWVSKAALYTEQEYNANLATQAANTKAKQEAAVRAEQAAAEAAIAEKQADAEAFTQRRDALTKKYGATTAQKILAGQIWIGMTAIMALESIGAPEERNRTVGSWGVHEQWVYGDDYLYFENDVLTSWQDRR